MLIYLLQIFKRENWKTQSAVEEVQEVIISTNNPDETVYRLGIHGVYTGELYSQNINKTLFAPAPITQTDNCFIHLQSL